MRDKMKYIGIVGVVFGFVMSKILRVRYGDSGSVILASVAFTIIVISVISLVIMKKYIIVLLTLFMVLPCIVMLIGIFTDNLYAGGVGLISLIIAIPIMIKITPKLKDKYRS